MVGLAFGQTVGISLKRGQGCVNGNVEEVLNRHCLVGLVDDCGHLAIVAANRLVVLEPARSYCSLAVGSVNNVRVAAIFLVFWMLLAGASSVIKRTCLICNRVDDSASMQTADGLGTSTGSDARASRWDRFRKFAQCLVGTRRNNGRSLSRQVVYDLGADSVPQFGSALESTLDQVTQALSKHNTRRQQSRLGDGLSQVLQRQSGRPGGCRDLQRW